MNDTKPVGPCNGNAFTKNDAPMVTFTVQLAKDEAWALAQLFKRIGYAGYGEYAENRSEIYKMLFAGEKVRSALAKEGIAPR